MTPPHFQGWFEMHQLMGTAYRQGEPQMAVKIKMNHLKTVADAYAKVAELVHKSLGTQQQRAVERIRVQFEQYYAKHLQRIQTEQNLAKASEKLADLIETLNDVEPAFAGASAEQQALYSYVRRSVLG